MTTRPFRRAFALALVARLSMPATAEETLAGAGERLPDHEFVGLVGHDGRTRLSDLHGSVVVVAGFRRYIPDGLHAAWQADEMRAKARDDGLVLIGEETRDWSGDAWAITTSFWMRILGSTAWIAPQAKGAPDLPIRRAASKRDDFTLVLIGVDGTLVMEGTVEPTSDKKKAGDFRVAFARALDAELKRRKAGWGELPAARSARAAAFGKREFGGAMRVLERARTSDGQLPDELAEVEREIAHAFAVAQKQLRFLLDDGRYRDAEKARRDLAAAAKGHAPFESAVAAMEAEIDADAFRNGLQLDRQLGGILKNFEGMKLNDLKIDDLVAARAFAASHEEHAVGRRARRLEPLLNSIVAATHGMTIPEVEKRVEGGGK